MTARRWFHLPYYHAQMAIDAHENQTLYSSHRTHRGAKNADFVGTYHPTGPIQVYAPDGLERWLTERYVLYAADNQKRVYRGDIHHLQWPIQPAEASIEHNTMTQASSINLPDTQPLLHYAHHLDVITWPLIPV
jgi:uncharacterized protein YqjF (DUF2071 family)